MSSVDFQESIMSVGDENKPEASSYWQALLSQSVRRKTKHLLDSLLEELPQMLQTDFRNKEEFIEKVNAKIKNLKDILSVGNCKDFLAKYFAYYNDACCKTVCMLCESTPPFKNLTGLYTHVRYQHYASELLEPIRNHNENVLLFSQALKSVNISASHHNIKVALPNVLSPVPVSPPHSTRTNPVTPSSEIRLAVQTITPADDELANTDAIKASNSFIESNILLEQISAQPTPKDSRVTTPSANYCYENLQTSPSPLTDAEKASLFTDKLADIRSATLKQNILNTFNLPAKTVTSVPIQSPSLLPPSPPPPIQAEPIICFAELCDDDNNDVTFTTNVAALSGIVSDGMNLCLSNDCESSVTASGNIEAFNVQVLDIDNIERVMSQERLNESQALDYLINNSQDATQKQNKEVEQPSKEVLIPIPPLATNIANDVLSFEKLLQPEKATVNDGDSVPNTLTLEKPIDVTVSVTSQVDTYAVADIAQNPALINVNPIVASATADVITTPIKAPVRKKRGCKRQRNSNTSKAKYLNKQMKMDAAAEKKVLHGGTKKDLENQMWSHELLRLLETESEPAVTCADDLTALQKINIDLFKHEPTKPYVGELKKRLKSEFKKVLNLKKNPQDIQQLPALARTAIDIDFYSKKSNQMPSNVEELVAIFLEFYDRKKIPTERKHVINNYLQRSGVHNVKQWQLLLRKLGKATNTKQMLLCLDNLKQFACEGLIAKIRDFFCDAPWLIINNVVTIRGVDMAANMGNLNKGHLLYIVNTCGYKDVFSMEDERNFIAWLRHDSMLKKKISLPCKFKCFMHRMVAVLQDADNPFNVFTRFSVSSLRKCTVRDLFKLFVIKDFSMNVEEHLTVDFCDNLMILMMKFLFQRFKDLVLTSHYSKRQCGPTLVDYGFVSSLANNDNPTFAHDIVFTDELLSIYLRFCSNDRIIKTITQMQVISMIKTPHSMDELRTMLIQNNYELVQIMNSKCSDNILTCLRVDMFMLVAQVCKNLVSKCATPNAAILETKISWEIFKKFIYDSSLYNYGDLVTKILGSFMPVVNKARMPLNDLWRNSSNNVKAAIFTELYFPDFYSD